MFKSNMFLSRKNKTARAIMTMTALCSAPLLLGSNAYANCGAGHGTAHHATTTTSNVCRGNHNAHNSHHTTYRTNNMVSNNSLLGSYGGHSQWSSNAAIPSTGYTSGTPISGNNYGNTSYSNHSQSSYGGILSSQEANARYGTGTISQTYSDGPARVIPFSTSSSNIGTYRLPGLGTNEYLMPTHCPVDVNNPNGGTVLGCYKVAKRTIVHQHVHIPKVRRIVRPVIYVRYPVPIAVPVPVYQRQTYQHHAYQHNGSNHYQCGSNSRYGANWPGHSFCR